MNADKRRCDLSKNIYSVNAVGDEFLQLDCIGLNVKNYPRSSAFICGQKNKHEMNESCDTYECRSGVEG